MKSDKAGANLRVCPICNKWVNAAVAESCTVGTCFNPSIDIKEKQFTLSEVKELLESILHVDQYGSKVPHYQTVAAVRSVQKQIKAKVDE